MDMHCISMDVHPQMVFAFGNATPLSVTRMFTTWGFALDVIRTSEVKAHDMDMSGKVLMAVFLHLWRWFTRFIWRPPTIMLSTKSHVQSSNGLFPLKISRVSHGITGMLLHNICIWWLQTFIRRFQLGTESWCYGVLQDPEAVPIDHLVGVFALSDINMGDVHYWLTFSMDHVSGFCPQQGSLT